MFHGVLKIVREANYRLRRVLRLRQHFSTKELVAYYKSEVLSFTEGCTPAMYQSSGYVLRMLDDVQLSFVESLGLSEEAALLDFNLAPLSARRDISMLGLLHRIAWLDAPSPLTQLFPRSKSTLHSFGWARGASHDIQLEDPVQPGHCAMFRRSLLGLVAVFNRLPQQIIFKTVTVFRTSLQRSLKESVALPNWRTLLHRTFKCSCVN